MELAAGPGVRLLPVCKRAHLSSFRAAPVGRDAPDHFPPGIIVVAPGRVRQHLGYCGECHGVLRVHPLGRGDHIRPRAFCVVGSGQRFPALQPPSKPGAAGTAQPGSGYLRGGGPFASSHAVTVAWVRGQCPPKLHPPPQSTCVGRSPPWAGPPFSAQLSRPRAPATHP